MIKNCSKGNKRCGKTCVNKSKKCSIKRKSPVKVKRSRKQSKKRSRKRSRNNEINIPLKKGELSKYGYKASYTAKVRRKALEKAIKSYGALSVYRKLNAVYVLNKNRSPSSSRSFLRDRNWVKSNYYI